MSELNDYMNEKLSQYNKYNDRANELMSMLTKISDHYEAGNTTKLNTIVDIIGGRAKKANKKTQDAATETEPEEPVAEPPAPEEKPSKGSASSESGSFGLIKQEITAINRIVAEIKQIKFGDIINRIQALINSLVASGNQENKDTIAKLNSVVAELRQLKQATTTARQYVKKQQTDINNIKSPKSTQKK